MTTEYRMFHREQSSLATLPAVAITPALEQRLHELTNVFLAENAKLNLSAFRTEELCWIGNVLDTVVALDLFPLPRPLPPGTSSIPHPLPPEEEGGSPRERTRRPRNKLFFAREMRKNPTEAEKLLWEHIRYDTFGVRFRRQFLCEGAIFDFYCPEQRIALEIDGGIHLSEDQRKYDHERDEYFLEERKISTLRFSNDQILHNLDHVLSDIKKHTHPPPPREEGEGVEVNKNNTEGKMHILDLGTGGGFPLLPLALCLPDCAFTGLDATQKKIDAVERMIAAMHIQNVSLISGRAEVLGKYPAHREQFDVVLCRAVAEINVLLEYAAPFAKVGGAILLWKSLNIDQELQDSLLARAELSCHLQSQHAYELPGNFGKRQILYFKKTAKTPAKYPREVGIPKKQPLL